MLEIERHLESRRHIYETKRTQQIDFLLDLLQTSNVKQQIRKLKFGLQINKAYDKDCKANRCIAEIRISHKNKGLEVKTIWAKNVIKKRVKVTCSPIQLKNLNGTEASNGTWFISKFHKTVQENCFQEKIENPTKIIHQQEFRFCNTSFENNNLRMTSFSDYDIPNGIIIKTNNKIMLSCTLEMYVMVNDIKRKCDPISPILVTNIT